MADNWYEEETISPDVAKVVEITTVKDDDDKLNIVYPVRLSRRLERAIAKQSKQMGLSKQAYIRKLIHDDYTK